MHSTIVQNEGGHDVECLVYKASLKSPSEPASASLDTHRTFTTVDLDALTRNYVHKLAEYQPCFAVSSKNIRIIQRPDIFYQQLLSMIASAKKRIVISTLYIGLDEDELVEALRMAFRREQTLHLYMVLDFNRSTRPGPRSTASLLLPLLKEFPDRVHINLYLSPKLKHFWAWFVPPRWRECWGIWHPKIYGADDDVMISGANLEKAYFSTRQDRYLLLSSEPQVAQYCFDFLESVTTFCYSLHASTDPSRPRPYELRWEDRHTHPRYIEAKAERALTKFQDAYRSSPTVQLSQTHDFVQDPGADVLLFPVLQAGQFNIREEEHAFRLLFKQLALHNDEGLSTNKNKVYSGPLLDLTTGYFGLYESYSDLVVQSSVASRVIASAPKANGFYGSQGASARLPDAYRLLEQGFMKHVHGAGRNWVSSTEGNAVQVGNGVQLREWEKDGWTYHAKGIWLRPTPKSNPSLTLFGSTNLNPRSANLDVELSFMLVTASDDLQHRLGEEVEALRQHTLEWRGADRYVGWITWILLVLSMWINAL